MKVVLKFNLPEDQEDFNTAINGGKYKSVLFDLNNFIRNNIKHVELSDEVYNEYKLIQLELDRLVSEYNLEI